MNCKLVKTNKSRGLLGAFLLLAFIPSAAFTANYWLTNNLDIVTNYPGIDYDVARAEIKSIFPGGARWGINGIIATTNVSGSGVYVSGIVPGNTYIISLTTQTNYYVPIQPEFAWTCDTNLTYYYIPFSNKLSVTVAGTNGMTSNVVWYFSSSPGELGNSTAYKGYYTNYCELTPVPTGQYTVAFPTVSGWTTPSGPTTFTNITWGSPLTNFITGTYARVCGTITVTNVSPTNGWWTFTPPSDYTNYTKSVLSGTNNAVMTNVPVGAYTITWGTLAGYSAPANTTQTNTVSSTNLTFTGTYTANENFTLMVDLQPDAAASAGARWQVDSDGTWRLRTDSHDVSTHISHYVDYLIARGYYQPTRDSFSSTTNLTLTKNYIPYSNSLSVVINGMLAGTSATWSITSPSEFTNSIAYRTTYTDSQVLSLIPTGIYTIAFSNVTSYIKPANITTNITGALNPTVTGTYVYISLSSTNDSDGDGLPDGWEIKYGLDPYSPIGTNGASGNVDNDWIPSASTNTPILISIDSSNIVYVTFSGNGDPSYPLQHIQLLRHLKMPGGELPDGGSELGYSKGVPFNNLLECRGLDGYYLTNGPNGTWVPNDDPLTSPVWFDTSSTENHDEGISDGWKYYFWYWRSKDAYDNGITNSANLSWVTWKRTSAGGVFYIEPTSDTDGDGFADGEEYTDTWTDPTHCDTDGDGMDDYWEISVFTPSANSNALDYVNNWSNPDSDYMAWVNQGMLSNGMGGTVLGTNVCYTGASNNPSAAWNDTYTNNGTNVFDLYQDTILKASSGLINHAPGARYAYTNYYGTNAGLSGYKNGYPVWVDVDNSGTYSAGDYALVNPTIKHDGVYRMAPAIPGPGVCSFDPRIAWTVTAATNTIPYTTYQEYLGGDYIGRLTWDAGGQRKFINDEALALNRNSYTLPNNQDTDTDLIPDGWELYVGLNPNSSDDASLDSDSDALNNFSEWANATHSLGTCIATWPNKPWPTDPGIIVAPSPNDPHPKDTDWDGLLDGYVVEGTNNIGELLSLSNPTQVDTDEDGLPDGWEMYAGTDPLVSDANLDFDHDGLRNWQEYWTGTVDEWMLCDPDWGLYFLARRLMSWDSTERLVASTKVPVPFSGSDEVDTRWFIPPDFLTDPSFLYYNGITNNLDWLRSTNGFPAASSLGCGKYHTTFANETDSDRDGMDDFWEVFYCLNPIRGLTDLNYGIWDIDRQGGNMLVGSTDADPTQAGNQVGTQGHPFANAMALVNYWKTLRAIDASTVGGAADQEEAVIDIVGPHNFGLEGMDPDGDGLVNSKELEVHTAPSPIWRTDRFAWAPYQFVFQNYTRDNTFRAGGWENLGFSGGFGMDGDNGPPPFRWAAKSEGFDTDNDLISDYDELTGYRTNGITASTDPLNDESPLRNRVLWLDGTNSWASSYKWHFFGDFKKFSVEAWVKPSRLRSGANQVVVEKTASYIVGLPNGTNTMQTVLANFQLGINSAGVPYVLFNGLSGFITTNLATAAYVPGQMEVDKWVHLAGVFDGSNLMMYVNGEVSTTHPTTDVPANGFEQAFAYWWPCCSINVGAHDPVPSIGRSDNFPGTWFTTNFFAGCIDEVRVWDRVVSAGEIKARKDRRLTPAEVGTVIGGNNPFVEGANNLFAYYRFTDLPDPKIEGILPKGFPANRPALSPSVNYSSVYTNYLVIASDRVKRIPRLPPLDTRVIDGTPIATNDPPDSYGICTTNYLDIQLPADFRNSANPLNFTDGNNTEIQCGMWLLGNAQGLKGTNTWLPTLDPNNPDSSDSDGDGLPDWWEQLYGLDIYDATGNNGAWGDPDNDGLNNRAEYLAGTNPRMGDTNGDGIGDYDSRSGPYTRTWGEMYMDGDGMPDTWEMLYGLDPYHYDANLDLDNDGWSNLAEYLAGTDPSNPNSYPQPAVFGSADYFGDKSGTFRFYVYATNTMDGEPLITQVGAGQQVAETIGTADGTLYFSGRLPLYPIDQTTVVRISAPAGTNSATVTFTFTSPTAYTYSGVGSDYSAGLNYTTGRIIIRWASTEVPVAGANVSVDYTYANRNSAAFSLTGFREGDFYLLALLDNGNNTFDAGEPMGIMEGQPLTLGYTSLSGVRVQIKDNAPGYGRFAWTASTTSTTDYPVVINKISENGAPTVLTRSVRWSRNYLHEWDYQIAGLYGLPNGNYQWWMNSQQGTFHMAWPSSLSTPSLVYPRGEQFNYAVNQFKWTMDVNSTMYHLQVARKASDGGLAFVLDNYYPTPYCDQNGVSQANLPLYAGELGDGVYYWRVASWSPAGESAWAEPQTFNINLSATNSHSIAGDIYYFGKADCANIIVEAFDNRGFSGKPDARVLVTGAVRSNSFKGSFTLRGLEAGTYYVRAYLDVTPAGGTRDGKRNSPWESWGFIRDPNNDYQPRPVGLLDTMFVDGTKLVIRDQDTDNDLLPDAWEMYYFGDLNQTGDMDYDGDGETNLEEYMRDGVDMNPAAWDTDGDGLSDAFELNYTAPSFGYSAKSGQQLNPMLWDTDGDGYSDGAEMKRYHTDPLDPTSYPRYQPMCFDAFRSPGDYDGDGRSDLSVYDIANGNWYVMTAAGQFGNLPFGSSATQPMLGDYDGDGNEDFAVFEPATGAWHLYNAWTGQSFRLNFGDSEMMPVPADYDGDNKTDLAVYYPADGMWYIYSVWSGQFYSLKFGGPTCVPVPGDYNNDGAGDLATYEPNTGNWNIFTFDHYRHEGKYFSGNFGGPTMIPVGGDYDGDGRNDAALFEPTTGNWYILTWRGQFLSGQFGGYGCIPAPGDYDGDGRTDVCVYYPPTGTWYIYCWSGQAYEVQFGFSSATPALKGR